MLAAKSKMCSGPSALTTLDATGCSIASRGRENAASPMSPKCQMIGPSASPPAARRRAPAAAG
jgi:hypothetical protein